jgi:hypothetical protein
MIKQTVQELTPLVGTCSVCRALGAAPATIYRGRRPPESARSWSHSLPPPT